MKCPIFLPWSLTDCPSLAFLMVALSKRLEDFRGRNTDESTVLNFFDEKEIHPMAIQVERQTTDQIMQLLYKRIGKPHNYGPSAEQIAEKKRKLRDEKVQLNGTRYRWPL
jgi:hypothetical protein